MEYELKLLATGLDMIFDAMDSKKNGLESRLCVRTKRRNYDIQALTLKTVNDNSTLKKDNQDVVFFGGVVRKID